jgi:hypothetical protein
MHNPYAPPKAELELDTPEPEHVDPVEPLQYAGFWRRFGAHWIDILVWLPVTAIVFFVSGLSRMGQLYCFLPESDRWPLVQRLSGETFRWNSGQVADEDTDHHD